MLTKALPRLDEDTVRGQISGGCGSCPAWTKVVGGIQHDPSTGMLHGVRQRRTCQREHASTNSTQQTIDSQAVPEARTPPTWLIERFTTRFQRPRSELEQRWSTMTLSLRRNRLIGFRGLNQR